MSNRLVNGLAAWVAFAARNAQAVVITTFLAVVAAGYYTSQTVSVNTDTDSLIDPSAEFRRVYGSFKDAFPQLSDTMVFVVRANAPELADLAAEALVEQLAQRSDLFENSFALSTDPFFQQNGLLLQSTDELIDLVDQLAEAQPFLAKLAEDPSLRGLFEMVDLAVTEAEGDPDAQARLEPVLSAIAEVLEGEAPLLSWQRILSAEDEQAVRYVTVQPVLDFNRIQPAKPAMEAAQELAAEVQSGLAGPVQIEITGKIPLSFDELRSVSDGAATAGILSFIFVAFVLGFGLRSWQLVAATLLMIISGLVLTAGFAMLAVGSFNMISVAFAVLFIGLSVDFAIHFCLRYQEARTREEHLGALAETARGTGFALLVCAPTTALAFYAFTPTGYAGLSQLGLIAGTGMFIALILSITLLPALLTVFPSVTPRAASNPQNGSQIWIEQHARSIVIAAVVLGLGSTFLASGARFDPDQLNLKDDKAASVLAYQRLLEDEQASPYTAHVLVDDLKAAEVLAAQLEGLDPVASAVMLNSFVPDGQDEKLMLIDQAALLTDPVFFAFPVEPPNPEENLVALRDAQASLSLASDSAARALGALLQDRLDGGLSQGAARDLEAQLLDLFPRTLSQLERSLSAQGFGADDLPTYLIARYKSSEGSARVEVRPAENLNDPDAMAAFIAEVTAIAPQLTGPPVQMIRSGEVVAQSMVQATAYAAALITLALIVVLRRGTDVALVLIPLALAGVMTLAATVILDLPFNFANVIVLPLLIGLGVDGGIHVMLRARETESTALLESSTPKAVFISAITTIGSFGTLAVSPHRGTASMGELLTVSVALTLVCMLVVLPALLKLVKSRS